MTRPCLLVATLAVPLTLLCFAGCQAPNPAFDPGAEVGDTGEGAEASTTQTSSNDDDPTGDGDGESETTVDTGDGDGDADTGDGDGESETTVDTGMEAPIEPDMPAESCVPSVTEGLLPRYGSPEQFDNATCPGYIGEYVRVVGTTGGDWLAVECEPYCTTCNDQAERVIGAHYLQLASLMPPANDPNNAWLDCHYIQANPLVSQANSACVYGSLSIHMDEGPGSPLQFNANRESWGLTDSAVQKIGEWQPMVVDQVEPETCLCEDTDIDCCPGQTVVAKKFLVPDAVYPPGQSPVMLGNGLWHMFFGAQAQSGTTCDLDPETSWAILAEG